VSSLPQLDEECFFIAPIGKEGSPERNRSDGVLLAQPRRWACGRSAAISSPNPARSLCR
jgi:hypothetical protein